MNEVKLPALRSVDWDWHARAACAGMGSEFFYATDNERGKRRRMRENAAKAICAECPVRRQCLDWALAVREPDGVWGGKTTDERMELLAPRFEQPLSA